MFTTKAACGHEIWFFGGARVDEALAKKMRRPKLAGQKLCEGCHEKYSHRDWKPTPKRTGPLNSQPPQGSRASGDLRASTQQRRPPAAPPPPSPSTSGSPAPQPTATVARDAEREVPAQPTATTTRASFCQHCGERLSDVAKFCHACGQPVASAAAENPAEPVEPPAPTPPSTAAASHRAGGGSIAVLVALIVVGAGFFRLYYGAEGMRLMPKSSFSFEDTIVNLDDMAGMPRIVAAAQHPSVKRQLEQMDIIDTDEEAAAKVAEEVRQKMEEEQRKQEAKKDALVLQSGWHWTTGEYGTQYIEGTVENTSGNSFSYVSIQFDLSDTEGGGGATVGTATDLIANLGPFATWKFRALVMEQSAIHAHFSGITAY